MKWALMIKELRNKMFLTQSELGKILGVTYNTINRYENDKFEPTMKVKRKLNTLFIENGISEKGE